MDMAPKIPVCGKPVYVVENGVVLTRTEAKAVSGVK